MKWKKPQTVNVDRISFKQSRYKVSQKPTYGHTMKPTPTGGLGNKTGWLGLEKGCYF